MDSKKSQEKKSQAIALSYNPGEEAPTIVATGTGALADRIIEKATENNVPVHRDDKLAETLSKLQIGDLIPKELYGVVAEILVFVDTLDKIKGKMKHDK